MKTNIHPTFPFVAIKCYRCIEAIALLKITRIPIYFVFVFCLFRFQWFATSDGDALMISWHRWDAIWIYIKTSIWTVSLRYDFSRFSRRWILPWQQFILIEHHYRFIQVECILFEVNGERCRCGKSKFNFVACSFVYNTLWLVCDPCTWYSENSFRERTIDDPRKWHE